MDTVTIYRHNLRQEQKDNNINCLKKKFFPNYVFIILIAVSVASIISTIAVAVTKSDSSSEEKKSEQDRYNDISSLVSDESWEKYKKAEKYLYIWEYYTPDYIINMCQEHHFTRVYLSIGCIETFWDNYYSQGKFPARGEIGSLDYETFIKQLNDINVEVELVTFLNRDGNGDDFTNVVRVDTVANMVKELSKKVQIKALHFDQESNRKSIEGLLQMYIRANKIFPVSAILRPFYLYTKLSDIKQHFTDQTFYESFSDCETIADALMKITKFTDLMAYNENYAKVEEYMEDLKKINSRHSNNEAKNIIEIGFKIAPTEDTLHQRYIEDKNKFFDFVYDMSKKYNGITIHYFEEWYETLYCTWPKSNIPYDGGEPKNCN